MKRFLFFALPVMLLTSCETREELDANLNRLTVFLAQAEENVVVRNARIDSLEEKIDEWNPPGSGRCVFCYSDDSLQARNTLRFPSKEDLERSVNEERQELARAEAQIRELCKRIVADAAARQRRFGVESDLPKSCKA